MQIPYPAVKPSLLRVFLLSMAGLAILFSLMALGIWASTTDVLKREARLFDLLLPKLDVAHQLTAATAGLQAQGYLLSFSQTQAELESRQNLLRLTLSEIDEALNDASVITPGVQRSLRDSVSGIATITTGLSDVRAEQIRFQDQVHEEIQVNLEVLADVEKEVQRAVFSLTGRLLSISNSMKLASIESLDSCAVSDEIYDFVSDYDAVSLAIQDYLLLGRDVVSLNAVLEKVPLLTDRNQIVLALKKHNLLIRALVSRINFINQANRSDTLLEQSDTLAMRTGSGQTLFSLQSDLLEQEQGQSDLYERLQQSTVLILERTGEFRDNTRTEVSVLAQESLDGLSRDRNVPMILCALALLLLAGVSYWLVYRKTVLPLMAITQQLDDVGTDRFPQTTPDYYLKELSALSSAMIQLDDANTNMLAKDAQLQGVNNELQRANEELEQFAHIASHDLQEPLRKLQQFSELLLIDHATDLDKEGVFFIDAMHRAAKRMSVLIRETLAYSRSGSRNQSMANVDLSQLLPDLLEEVDLAIQEAQGEFIVGALPTVLANELGMAQLFRNLLTNGLKYRRPQVPARISITVDELDTDTKDVLYLRVEDNGIGMSADDLDKVFTPFVRLNASEVPGTGLGLAICKKVCDSHGWTLEVSSTVGQGSTFLIGVPRLSIKA